MGKQSSSVGNIIEIIEHCLYAGADCSVHNTEHLVSGKVRDKKDIGGMKDFLIKQLREDYPDCKLQPKAFVPGYNRYVGDGKNGVWTSHSNG